MSTLQKVKAYFGMVPIEEYNDHYDEGSHDHSEYNERASREQSTEHYGGEDSRASYSRRGGHYYGDEEVPSARIDMQHSTTNTARLRGIGYPSVTAPKYNTSVPHATQGDLALDNRNHYVEDVPVTGQIITLKPKDYSQARIVGERFREGSPVIMDLVNMENADAKRLVDFAAGLAFALRGTFDKVATKVFLLSPAGIEVSAEDRKKLVETGFYSRDYS